MLNPNLENEGLRHTKDKRRVCLINEPRNLRKNQLNYEEKQSLVLKGLQTNIHEHTCYQITQNVSTKYLDDAFDRFDRCIEGGNHVCPFLRLSCSLRVFP